MSLGWKFSSEFTQRFQLCNNHHWTSGLSVTRYNDLPSGDVLRNKQLSSKTVGLECRNSIFSMTLFIYGYVQMTNPAELSILRAPFIVAREAKKLGGGFQMQGVRTLVLSIHNVRAITDPLPTL